ncbi:hypothetical protein [Glutamicibacter sp. NPDC087344]|uniref:hypothetical protein n=1 Tax=Glutamicibacter sp. NPDC087344 TaxID=3363994 RepID=UPI00380CCA65
MNNSSEHILSTGDGRPYTLVPLRDTAVILGMTVQGLGIWRHTGYGPASVLIGRKRFYRSCDLDNFLNELFEEAQVAA